jgi:hypothetical protein
MPKMTAAKIIEHTAALAALAAGGGGMAAKYITAFLGEFDVEFSHTDETTAKRRLSDLWLCGHRVNPGRGERLFDAVVAAPILGMGGAVVEKIPVAIKAGDARDISTDIKLAKAAVEAGAPIWVYIMDGTAEAVEYDEGVHQVITPARNLTMRRINITPLLRDEVSSWEIGDGEGKIAFVRADKRKSGGKEYIYPRLRINWGKVPSHYWLDASPIPFDAGAPLPCPWW